MREGQTREETIADCPPWGSLVTAKQDIANVDSANFTEYVRILIDDFADLTAIWRKVLLLYDGYQIHIAWMQ